jgi:hypothetical protein
MIINPLVGIDNISFGMKNTEVEKLLGEPEKVKNKNSQEDEFMPEVWFYYKLGLELEFDSFYKFRLDRITIKTNDSFVSQESIIGLPEEDLLELFPTATLDAKYKQIKEYTCGELKLEIYLKNNIVDKVVLEPDPNIEFYTYCSKNFQRNFTCKRILKGHTRTYEKKVAAGLFDFKKGISISTLDFLPSNIEWFLGSYLTLNPETRRLGCDGIVLKDISLIANNTIQISAIADIESAGDDASYEVCALDGFIKISSNGKRLKKYLLELKHQGKIITLKK